MVEVQKNPRLQICTITYDWYPFHARVRGLVEAAMEAGHDVDVICIRQPHEKRREVYNNVNIYRVPMNRSQTHSVPQALLSWCWFLILAGITVTWLHLKRRYHVIHVHNLPDFLVFSAFFPRLLGAKVILDVQDPSPELMAEKASGRSLGIVRRLTTWQEHLSTAFVNHVITIGWTVEELLLQRGVPREKLTSILNSANPAFFPPARRRPLQVTPRGDSQPFILMYHGTVAQRQGLDTAVRAVALASQKVPQLRFFIKGFGDQLDPVRHLAEELGVSDRVIFSEPCPIGEIADFVTSGDVGIIPYQRGGYMELVLPVKAFEFAWMHCPMIATRTRGMVSLFREESVMYCDASKPESFAEAIIELYQHPEKCASIATNAACDYLPYTWEAGAERYQQLLLSLGSSEKAQSHSTTNISPVQ